jgi:hypothetical protein
MQVAISTKIDDRYAEPIQESVVALCLDGPSERVWAYEVKKKMRKEKDK